MNFDILIPTQEQQTAYNLLEYSDNIMEAGFSLAKKLAVQIADAKYWEAYDCEKAERQEYWRQVKIRLDTIDNFTANNP
jgi:hypothetical protein